MEHKELSSEKKLELRKEKIRLWLKNKDNFLFLLLMCFSLIIYVYYFFKLGAQPIWWDEGDYLAIAKVWALNQPTPDWWGHFTGMRPLLIPLIFAAMFKIGCSEMVIRFFVLLLPSLAIVLLTYLVASVMYTKKVGFIAGLMMSSYWVFLFYSFRLLTDIPSVFFGMLTLYFFINLYIGKGKNYGLYLSVVSGILAFSTRFPLALVFVSIIIYLLFIKKLAVFKDKTIWKAILVGILCFMPYVIYFISTKFYLFKFYFGAGAISVKQAVQWNIIPMIFSFLDPATQVTGAPIYYHIFGFTIILGLLSLIPFFIGLDIFWKQKDKMFNYDFFLVIFLIIHLIFYIIIFRAANDRWLLMLMPMIFILCAKGLVFLYKNLKKYNLYLAATIVLILLLGGVYQNFSHANQLIENKKTSYGEIKLAGEWLKENTPTDAKIITASIVQNQYYSERDSYAFYTNDSIWASCTDLYGSVSANETCQRGTEEAFIKNRIEKINPSYMIVSVFEPVFTPQWAYTYAERHNLTAVHGYSDNQGNPILIIYQF